jgi:hypothetical protein
MRDTARHALAPAAALLLGVALPAGASAAPGGSIVYAKGGNVYRTAA